MNNELEGGLIVQSSYVLEQTSEAPLRLPGRANWKDITLEHHQQPPGACEFSVPQHAICISLQDNLLERRVNGGQVQRSYVMNGNSMFYPAEGQQWIRWSDNADFLLLFLEPALLEQVADRSLPATCFQPLEKAADIADPLITQIGLALAAEITGEHDFFSPLYIDSLSHTLVAHLLKHRLHWQQEGRSSILRLSSLKVQDIAEYIQSKLDQPVTLNELAALAGMSPYHFIRVFRQATGFTPHQYIMNARIQRAKILLLQRELPLSEIAMNLGFADQSHFTRAFKRVVGVTPQLFSRSNNSKTLQKKRTFFQDNADSFPYNG